MPLHRCRGERWGRSEGCAGNRPHGETVRDTDTNGRCLVVEIGNGRTGREVKSTGAGVGNASAGGR